jgi:hypothetical protein
MRFVVQNTLIQRRLASFLSNASYPSPSREKGGFRKISKVNLLQPVPLRRQGAIPCMCLLQPKARVGLLPPQERITYAIRAHKHRARSRASSR